MAIFSKLKYALVFGAAAVYAEDKKADSPTDHDDADFDEMSGSPAADDDMGDMGGMGGGPGGEGMPDMEAMFKLDKSCETPAARKEGGCKEGEKWVQKALTADTKEFVAYGCSSSDFMAQMMGKETQEKSKAEDCCIVRDIAMASAGATKEKIEDAFEACLTEKCGEDKDCPFQAKMGPVMEQMMGGEGGPCKGFFDAQDAAGMCVAEGEYDAKFGEFVTSFNEHHGTSFSAADAGDDHAAWVQKIVFENREKAVKMEKKADPFAGMGGMGGMGEEMPQEDGEDDGSLEDSDDADADKSGDDKKGEDEL